MRLLIPLLISILSVDAFAKVEYSLKCSTKVSDKILSVSYTAEFKRMDLTQLEDGTSFGSSFGGVLKLTLDGELLLNRKIDAAAEEYGVVIKDGKLVYVNSNIREISGQFSDEEFFFITFGQSLDDSSAFYTTDSKVSEIGGGKKIPESIPADCESF